MPEQDALKRLKAWVSRARDSELKSSGYVWECVLTDVIKEKRWRGWGTDPSVAVHMALDLAEAPDVADEEDEPAPDTERRPMPFGVQESGGRGLVACAHAGR